MFVRHNANPMARNVGDCTVRAISKVLEKDWEETYVGLCSAGYDMCDMPSSNAVWAAYLRKMGYGRNIIDEECPDTYTVRDFCNDHKSGRYVLSLSGHVVAVVDGDYYDTFDSGDLIPLYYFYKREDK